MAGRRVDNEDNEENQKLERRSSCFHGYRPERGLAGTQSASHLPRKVAPSLPLKGEPSRFR
jgi:hypothetical protein